MPSDKALQSKDQPLPLLRRDIKIYKGPDDTDGTPTFNCLDPVSARYFKISWKEMLILSHLKPGMTLTALTEELNQHTTLKVQSDEVISFFDEANQNHLLSTFKSSEIFVKEADKRKASPVMWALQNYLYFRIPLLNPDAFLRNTLNYVRPLVSTPAILTYIILILTGLVLLIGRFDEFLTTFPYFFNLHGLITYGLVISLVKVVHEFSHAYVAKFYRLHVPTMGIAFIVLWPVLYTDVTDGWKLNRRSQRIAISAAGVAAELTLAGIATLGWALSTPGLLQSAFFIIASVTWISTLLVNINPAMRFDGYYLFCDMMGIDNLQGRAFAYTRWQLRKWLLGLHVPPPEADLALKRRIIMFIYTIYTWIYRILLYTAIAIFVYYEFTKALGIILFIAEVVYFMMLPFYWEAQQLKLLAPYMTVNFRSVTTCIVLSLFFLWFVLPLPHQERFAGLTVAAENQVIYIPLEGEIRFINFELDDQKKKGDILLELNNEPLEIQLAKTNAEIDKVKAEIHVLSLQEKERAFLPEKKAEMDSLLSKLSSIEQQKEQLTIRAQVNGTIYAKDDKLKVDQFVPKHHIVGKLGTTDNIEVIAFVPENKLSYLRVGQSVTFRLFNNLKWYQGKILKMLPMRTGTLIYPQVASIYEGDLPVVKLGEEKDQLVVLESYFLVLMELDEQDPTLRIGEKGELHARGPWKSLLMETLRYIQSIYLRESGF